MKVNEPRDLNLQTSGPLDAGLVLNDVYMLENTDFIGFNFIYFNSVFFIFLFYYVFLKMVNTFS